MTDALIGYTGFVGSTLDRQREFSAKFNSRNIDEIAGRHFGGLVCAGVSAAKWLANKNPEADIAAIQSLMDKLATVEADEFVLISTIDVYRDPIDVTETDEPLLEGLHPYGKHRRLLELFVAERFERHVIVRLPGLFGRGLRKNLIFDMLSGNQPHLVSPNGRLQWYSVHRLADDLDTIRRAGPKVVNIAVEPIVTETIRGRLFPAVAIGRPDMPGPRYDMKTAMPELLGGIAPYHIEADAAMANLARFVDEERARSA